MDIREIVETTLVAPMREQAAQARIAELELLRDKKQTEIQRQASLLDEYRRDKYAHEAMVGRLYTLLKDEDLDGAMDIVKDEFFAIHGPSD